LLTPKAYQIVGQLVRNAFKRRELMYMVYIIEQIQPFFEITVSPNPMSHIIKQMPGLHIVKGIPMERIRIMADENAIDAYLGCLITSLPVIPCTIIVNKDESGFADHPVARAAQHH
jgi:hypothetical protein